MLSWNTVPSCPSSREIIAVPLLATRHSTISPFPAPLQSFLISHSILVTRWYVIKSGSQEQTWIPTPDFRPPTPASRLLTPDSRPPDSRLPVRSSVFRILGVEMSLQWIKFVWNELFLLLSFFKVFTFSFVAILFSTWHSYFLPFRFFWRPTVLWRRGFDRGFYFIFSLRERESTNLIANFECVSRFSMPVFVLKICYGISLKLTFHFCLYLFSFSHEYLPFHEAVGDE